MSKRRTGGRQEGNLAAGDYPYNLTSATFAKAAADLEVRFDEMQGRSKRRVEERLSTPATLSALVSDLFEECLVDHAEGLVINNHHNGHPDTVPPGVYPGDAVSAGEHGVEVKATKNEVSDAHGARTGWWCQVIYSLGPSGNRVTVERIRLAHLDADEDFRLNSRKTDIGTRTATPNRSGAAKLRASNVYGGPSVEI